MLEVINETPNLTLVDFIRRFTEKIGKKKYNIGLSKDGTTYQNDAWIYTLRELSHFKSKNSLLSLGELQFDIPLDTQALDEYKMSAEEVSTFLRILLRNVMRDAAISTVQDIALDPSDWETISPSGFKNMYSKEPSSYASIISWLPEDGKSNRLVKITQKLLDIDKNCARELLKAIWDYFCDEAKIFVKNTVNYGGKLRQVYLLDYNLIVAKKPEQLFRCKECLKITFFDK